MTITNSTCSVEGWTSSKLYIFYSPSHYFRFPLSFQLSHVIITLFGGTLCCCLCFLWIGRHLSFYLDLQENLFQVLINWQVCCLSQFHCFDSNIIAVPPKHPLILNEVSDKSLRERVKIKIGLNCTYENIKNSLIMGVYFVDIFIREKNSIVLSNNQIKIVYLFYN